MPGRNRITSLSLWVASWFSLLLPAGAASFSPMESILNPSSPGAALWVDLDNDGDLDLLMNDGPDDRQRLVVFDNLGGAGFLRRSLGNDTLGVGLAVGITAADLDRDGRLDLALTWREPLPDSTSFSVWHNLGDWRFQRVPTPLDSQACCRLVWGDFDQDGDPDLVQSYVTPAGSAASSLFENLNGTFTELPRGTLHLESVNGWSDADGDGDLDLLGSGFQGVLDLNEGDGRFTASRRVPYGSWPFSTGTPWEDVDGDGDLDYAGVNATGRGLLWQNDGPVGFTSRETSPETALPEAATWGDADNDGDPDLLLVGNLDTVAPYSRIAELLVNDGTGMLTSSETSFGGGYAPQASWGDLDGDGDLDLLLQFRAAGPGLGTGPALFRNDSLLPNTPPEAPTGLKVRPLEDGSVELSWESAHDTETRNPRWLTYEIRAGRNVAGIEIASPPADRASGRRRVAGPGSLRTRSAILRGLSAGTYHWSVQAVDAAFAGSPWAAEQTFVVTNTPPQVSRGVDVELGMSQIATVDFGIGDAESPAESLVVEATSSDAGLLPDSSMGITGSGDHRSVTFRPAAGKTGVANLIVRVRDPGGLVTRREVMIHVHRFLPEPALHDDSVLNASPLPNVAASDLDGDGDLDLLAGVTRRTPGGEVEVVTGALLNDGHGQFRLGPLTPGIGWISVADFDRDGDWDLLSGGTWLRNEGTGRFTALPPLVTDQFGLPVAVGDFDGDGSPDVILDGRIPETAPEIVRRLMRNTPTGFLPGPAMMMQWNCPVLTGDLDGDGDLDLLYGSEFGMSPAHRIRRLLNRGDGNFETITTDFPPLQHPMSSAAWLEDEDGDGDPDALHSTGDGRTVLYRNKGNGILQPETIARDWRSAAPDVDFDGRPEHWLAVVPLVPGPGHIDLEFSTPAPPVSTSSLELSGVVLGDFDGDGDVDWLESRPVENTSGFFESRFTLLRNTSDATNAAPEPPAGLSSESTPGGPVTLRWQAPFDDHTPALQLTYRLRVGTRPGGMDIVSPGAAQAAAGNAGPDPIRSLRMLPPGSYYWSVQAVDGQFRAGVWAAEQSLVVDHPGITSLAEVVVPRAMPSHPIPIELTGDSRSAAADMKLSAVSGDPTLVPEGQIRFLGTGEHRSLVITAGDREGDTELLLTATGAGGWTGLWRIHVTVKRYQRIQLPDFDAIDTALDWLDFDGNGTLDLFATGFSYSEVPGGGPRMRLFRNTGDAHFELLPGAPQAFQRGTFLAGDANGNNVPDLFSIGSISSEPGRFWIQDSPFHFTPGSATVTNWATALAMGDADRDGVPDVLTWSGTQDDVQRQSAFSGSLTREPLVPPGVPVFRVAGLVWADFDGDGDVDLLCSGEDLSHSRTFLPPTLTLYLNDGRGHFTPVDSGLPPNALAVLSVADVDGDQLPDVFLSARPLQSWLREPPQLFRNLGGGRFTALPLAMPEGAYGVPAWGDADGDGDLDFILTGHPSVGSVPGALYRNNGRGDFSRIEDWFPQFGVDQAAWVDADGDGALDLSVVTFERGARQLTIWRSTSTISNSPPTAPRGLIRRPSGIGSLLTWDLGRDANDARFLTYNLRVGTRPGGSEIISALADPATGRRRTGGPGNLGPVRRRHLNLPSGTYYWAVQSVDAGHATSPFSEEQSFTVSQPEIRGLSNLVVPPNLKAGPFLFSVADSQTPEPALQVRVTSSAPELIADDAILLGRSNGRRSLEFTPRPHVSGSLRLYVEVTNRDGESVGTEIPVTILEEFRSGAGEMPNYGDPSAVWVDVQHDGFLDLILGGWQNSPNFHGGLELIPNRSGTVTRNVPPTLAGQFRPLGRGLATLDGDNDGIADLIVLGDTVASRLVLLRGDSRGGFERVTHFLKTLVEVTVSTADADGDGRVDVFMTGLRIGVGPEAVLFRNLGDFQFEQTSWIPTPGVLNGCAAWTDFDGDGDMDLLYSGRSGSSFGMVRTFLLANHGDHLEEVPTALPGIEGGAVAWTDVDGDGRPDLLLTGSGESGSVTQLYRQIATGVFEPIPTGLPALRNSTAHWVDADVDGWPDLLLQGTPSSSPGDAAIPITSLWYNNHDGTLTQSGSPLPLLLGGSATWADVNRDAAPDLLIAGAVTDRSCWDCSSTNVALVLLNHSVPAAPPPQAPSELQASLWGDEVTFTWQVPPGTPIGSTFNLRVGRTPGGSEVLSALADPTTGLRWVTGPGNAGGSGSWRLRGAAGQILYWSVQSIDTALRASPFAPEQIVDTRNERPSLSGFGSQTGLMNHSVGPLEFHIQDRETDAKDLRVDVASSAPSVVNPTGITVEGSGETRILTIRPQRDATGLVRITITVQDPLGARASQSFVVRFLAFSEAESVFPQVLPSAIEPADVDHDGVPELLITGTESGSEWAGFFARNPDDTYQPLIPPPLPLGPTRPAWADANGDGTLDLTAQGVWLQGSTDGYRISGTPDPDPGLIATWGDSDSDGDLDLVQVGGSRPFARLLINDGAALSEGGTPLVPVRSGAAAWGDADNDGQLDLAVTGWESEDPGSAATLRIYRNTGTGLVEAARFVGVADGTLHWADANQDGRVDLLMAGFHRGRGRERLFLNLGRFGFAETQVAAAETPEATGSTWADLDNDGALDLVENFSGGLWSARRNEGNGMFTRVPYALVEASSAILRCSDLDGDGDLDVIVGGPVSSGNARPRAIRIFRNHVAPIPDPVDRPTSLPNANSVHLLWPSMPSFRPGTRPTYNLRVGSTPGGFDIVAPMSDPETGRRRVPSPGNQGFAHGTRLQDLAPGTYHWSVQAVDSSWIGSPWLPEETFVISQAPPETRIDGLEWVTPLELRIAFQTTPGHRVFAESSTDLKTWTVESNSRADAGGRGVVPIQRPQADGYFRLWSLP